MEENKNRDMSVDELLAMLKATLQDEEGKEKMVEEKAAEEKPEETKEAEMLEESEELEEPEKAEETVEPEEADEPEEVPEAAEEEAEEEAAPLQINEEDIFAAWGISRDEMEQQMAETAETPVEENEESYSAPTVTANTKAYYITRVEKKDEYRVRKQTEAQRQTVDYDRTDYSLIKQALGMEKPEESEDGVPEFLVETEKDESATVTIDVPHDEFTYQRQKDDITADYKRSLRSSTFKLIASAVITVLLFLLECLPALGVALPNVFNTQYYPVVAVMAAMQLAWIAGALSYKEVANGVLSMRFFKPTSGSILALMLIFTTVCDAICCFIGGVYVFNFAVAFSATLVRAFEYMDIRREIFAFEVASSTRSKKYVMLTVSSDETGVVPGLEDYTGPDSLVLRTEKCSFVENYFARTEKKSDSDAVMNKYIVPVLVAVATAAAIICGVRGSVANGVSAFGASLAVGMPMLILLSSAYPLYKAGAKLSRSDSAIIGETAVAEYSGTTMICFDDADAFPSYGVALENLRIYGKGDIETIIEQMDAVFSKLGGPLRNVFALMISECPKPYRVKIEGIYEDGICAVVDGKTLYVGSAEYMEANGFIVTDKTNEIGGKRFSTMYLAEDGSLRAKFFIRYTLDGSFESIVKKLARRGIASVILTGDSNINDELLARSLDIKKLPVKVVRRTAQDSTAIHGDRADSGIVSAGAVGDLVNTVTMCDKLANVISTMRAVRIASAVICVLLAIGASLLGMASSVSSVHILIYHLFWLIPTWLVAKFNL